MGSTDNIKQCTDGNLGACDECPLFRENGPRKHLLSGTVEISCEAVKGTTPVQLDITDYKECNFYPKTNWQWKESTISSESDDTVRASVCVSGINC